MKRNDPFSALRIVDYRNFVIARFFVSMAYQMLGVLVGWQIYEITRDPLQLGLIGLADAIPSIGVALFAGHIADRHSRKRIVMICLAMLLMGYVLLWGIAWQHAWLVSSQTTWPIYAVWFLIGLARGFIGPSIFAFMTQLVPKKLYANSSTWNSSVFHFASMAGPALGGLVYGFVGIIWAFALPVLFALTSIVLIAPVAHRPMARSKKAEPFLESLVSGVHFVFKNQIMLAALALDMFAVLFGGVTALLPIFAGEILKVGPQGLGFLRAAPAIGAFSMAVVLAYFPPVRNTGKKLLSAVFAFGVCMLVFALSKNFLLSLVALAVSGAVDNVSVVIRQTIVQTFTPNHMRGRVSAVNNIFIGSSNEIGAFESGVAAKLLGVVPSVIFGGSMTLLVVLVSVIKAPKLRRLHLFNQGRV